MNTAVELDIKADELLTQKFGKPTNVWELYSILNEVDTKEYDQDFKDFCRKCASCENENEESSYKCDFIKKWMEKVLSSY